MAVQEIAKHTKNVVDVIGDREHGWNHKLREIALEIFIIVFAVTLSFWLHGLGEHRHEQQQVKSFLLGLKRDIQSDIRQVEGVVESQRKFDANFKYLASLDPDTPPDAKRFDAAYELLGNNSFLVPQVSRYEGFKSSGKLTNIENEELLEKIVKLYQFDIPKISMSFGGWARNQGKLVDYLEQETDNAGAADGRFRAITAPKGKRLLKRVQSHPQMYERYAILVRNGADIIKEIDKAYPEG